MKLMILAAAALFSLSAFAQYRPGMCQVDLVDIRTHRLITRITANDYGDGCKEGMKSCRLEIRQRNLLGRADCIRVGDTNPGPIPNPLPGPYPNPYPNPNPYPGSSDARRMINQNEQVYFNNTLQTVIGVSFGGQYAVRSNDGWNRVTNNVRREDLSVTNGCSMDICTSDSVIDVTTRTYVKVVGLSFIENFVTQTTDGWNRITSNVERRNLAATKGCIASRYAQICVGNVVIDQSNTYQTVVGIQLDGRVALRSNDGWNRISTNVEPSNLVITR